MTRPVRPPSVRSLEMAREEMRTLPHPLWPDGYETRLAELLDRAVTEALEGVHRMCVDATDEAMMSECAMTSESFADEVWRPLRKLELRVRELLDGKRNA